MKTAQILHFTSDKGLMKKKAQRNGWRMKYEKWNRDLVASRLRKFCCLNNREQRNGRT